MAERRRLGMMAATCAALALLVASGCDKSDAGGTTSSAAAKSTAASTAAPKKADPAALVKDLADPAKRKAAQQALIDYEWDKVAGGFPITAKEALEEILTGSADNGAVRAAIKVCEEISETPGVSFPCDDGLKVLIKKSKMLSSDDAKLNRTFACGALSAGAQEDFEEHCK